MLGEGGGGSVAVRAVSAVLSGSSRVVVFRLLGPGAGAGAGAGGQAGDEDVRLSDALLVPAVVEEPGSLGQRQRHAKALSAGQDESLSVSLSVSYSHQGPL